MSVADRDYIGEEIRRQLQQAPHPVPARFEQAERLVAELCRKLQVKMPLVLFGERLDNAGAAGEAGQSTIRLSTPHVLNSPWEDVERTIRHEVAHIVVHNTPGLGDVPAHGREFQAALVVVNAVHISSDGEPRSLGFKPSTNPPDRLVRNPQDDDKPPIYPPDSETYRFTAPR